MQADIIENRTFNEITIGESASLTRTLTKDDIALFAVMSGDVNPAYLDQGYAETSAFHRIIAQRMWGGHPARPDLPRPRPLRDCAALPSQRGDSDYTDRARSGHANNARDPCRVEPFGLERNPPVWRAVVNQMILVHVV